MNLNRFFSLIGTMLIGLFSNAQQDKFTLDNYEFYGPIETIKTEHYNVPKPKKPGNLLYTMEYEFTRKGEVEEYTFEMDLGFIFLESTTTYVRDERGWVIKEEFDNGDKTYTSATYEYDEAGNITIKKDLDSDGDVNTTTTYEYDERGNLILIDCDKDASGYDYKMEYEYDSEDRKVKYKYSSLSVKRTIEYVYDGDDNVIEENNKYQSSDNKGRPVTEVTLTKREFNSDNKCTVAIDYNSSGDMIEKRIYEYDGDGNRTKATTYNHKGKVVRYVTYEGYDEHGNYKETYTYVKNKVSSYSIREIEYH